MITFDVPFDVEEKADRKHCGKRRKCWKPAFSPFSKMFSTLLNKIALFETNSNSSANYNLPCSGTSGLNASAAYQHRKACTVSLTT